MAANMRDFLFHDEDFYSQYCLPFYSEEYCLQQHKFCVRVPIDRKNRLFVERATPQEIGSELRACITYSRSQWWYDAQLHLYGLPETNNKALARVLLYFNLRNNTLMVPENLRQIEMQLRMTRRSIVNEIWATRDVPMIKADDVSRANRPSRETRGRSCSGVPISSDIRRDRSPTRLPPGTAIGARFPREYTPPEVFGTMRRTSDSSMEDV